MLTVRRPEADLAIVRSCGEPVTTVVPFDLGDRPGVEPIGILAIGLQWNELLLGVVENDCPTVCGASGQQISALTAVDGRDVIMQPIP